MFEFKHNKILFFIIKLIFFGIKTITIIVKFFVVDILFDIQFYILMYSKLIKTYIINWINDRYTIVPILIFYRMLYGWNNIVWHAYRMNISNIICSIYIYRHLSGNLTYLNLKHYVLTVSSDCIAIYECWECFIEFRYTLSPNILNSYELINLTYM